MNVSRDIILDLLPVYLAGEASPATRELVESCMQHDEDLARRVRLHRKESFTGAAAPSLPPDLELRSLRRTRRILALLRWLFGCAIGFTAVAFSLEVSIKGGRPVEFHPLLRDYPVPLGGCLLLGLACWLAYYIIRRRLRTMPV